MENYQPPITITNKILELATKISELIGKTEVEIKKQSLNPKLRKENMIRTIHSSLAIENNSLSVDQVTSIIDGKIILGEPAQIGEVKNAFEAYKNILNFDPFQEKDLLKAHALMMDGLVSEVGRYRSGGVGIFAGESLIHMAPPASFVPELMFDLFNWVKTSDLNMLIRSSVFHYEFEFIHPFQDGNGRMGRFWQTLLLSNYNKLFVYLPIENLIKERQQEYYSCLAQADKDANSTPFVEFLLQVILDTLKNLDFRSHLPENTKKVLGAVGSETLTAKQIMARLGLSHMQTFRNNYLKPALAAGEILMTEPDKPNSKNQKYYKK